MPIDFSRINWLAVMTAAFATFMLGGIWYTALFGKLWQRLHSYSDDQLAQMRRNRPPPVFFGVMILGYMVMALTTAMIVTGLDARSWMTGAAIGLVLWAGVLAVQATGHVASNKPWSALWLDAAYQLIYLTMTGAIAAGWK
jgi:hypothetical protein